MLTIAKSGNVPNVMFDEPLTASLDIVKDLGDWISERISTNF